MEKKDRYATGARRLGAVLSCAITAAGFAGCGSGFDPCGVEGASQSVKEYADACYAMIGEHIPGFDCDDEDAVEIPVTHHSGDTCDRPNVLNDDCDHGSTFHVLVKTSEAFAVAICRKKGRPTSGKFGDIAIIAHNQTNGATCFFQAWPNKDGAGDDLEGDVGSPEDDPPTYPWMTPASVTSEGFRCVTCHDNGPVIRSPYLAQLADLPGADEWHRLPGTADSMADPDWPKIPFNKSTPYKFVGNEMQSWRVESLDIPGTTCTSCHRMGLGSAFGNYAVVEDSTHLVGGTAGVFGEVATDETLQSAKKPWEPAHEAPFWLGYMTGQWGGDATAHSDALKFKTCAENWANDHTPTSGCTVTQYGQGLTCSGGGGGGGTGGGP